MAETYDLMVIDHPHVGEVALRQGNLYRWTGCAMPKWRRCSQRVGRPPHPSYNFAGRAGRWRLTLQRPWPACAPICWTMPETVVRGADPARAEKVGFALIPINALMSFFGMARNIGRRRGRKP